MFLLKGLKPGSGDTESEGDKRLDLVKTDLNGFVSAFRINAFDLFGFESFSTSANYFRKSRAKFESRSEQQAIRQT